MELGEVINLFSNVKKQGQGYICQCPVCNDENHLYINEKDGKVLFYCQKCNAGFNKIREVMPELTEKPKSDEVIEQYDHVYKNTDGTVAYYKTRTKYADGRKKFTFYHFDNGKKKFTKPDECNCLYNLDSLHNADKSETLYIVEGEKCVDIMTKHGFIATTTNTGGGNAKIKFSKVDLEILSQYPNKVVIPDNDEIGMKYAEHFPDAEVLHLDSIWQGIKPKQDIYDYIQSGQDLDLIRNYIFDTDKEYSELTKEELVSDETFRKLLSIKDSLKRVRAETDCRNRAREFKIYNDFNALYKTYKQAAAKKNKSDVGNKTEFIDQPIELNCGDWIANSFGVKIGEYVRNGEEYIVKFASPIPIMPSEILQNMDTGIEKIRLHYYKQDKWESVICARSVVANQGKIIELADKGIEVNSENSKLLVKYIADCVAYNLDTLPYNKAISRLGWVGNDFMPYDTNIKFDGERESKYLFEAVCQKGSFERWLEHVTPLRENIYMRLAMAASFASPLIEKVNALPFVCHFWGGTGTGKSVALMVAMSIWGNPVVGEMVKTMNMTANSMCATAAFLCNIPFAGDELQIIKDKWSNYDSLIMKVTEGVDRGRMSYDKINETKTWKCSFIFTGEEPCTKSGSGGGAKNRVIEIECKDKTIEDGNSTVNFITENYGHAGIKYIDHVRNIKTILTDYAALFKEIITDYDTTEKQAMAMALILLGDRYAAECLFPNDKPIKLSDVSMYLQSTKEVDVSERSYDFVINLVARNENRFQASDRNNGEVWGKIDEYKQEIVINKDVLIKEMSLEGFEFDAVKSKWADKGYLIRNSQGKLIHQTKCNGTKANYVKIKPKEGDFEDIDTEGLPFD